MSRIVEVEIMTNDDGMEILSNYSIDTNNLIELKGPWDLGYAISLHSISSVMTSYNQYDTTYTPVGEILNKFKYRGQLYLKNDLVSIATAVIKMKFCDMPLDILTIPPPNTNRVNYQPMDVIANSLSSNLGIEFCKTLDHKKTDKSMKSLVIKGDKVKYLIENLYCTVNDIENKNIVIIDDIFDSGATLEICTQKLKEHRCKNVYVLTFTKTR